MCVFEKLVYIFTYCDLDVVHIKCGTSSSGFLSHSPYTCTHLKKIYFALTLCKWTCETRRWEEKIILFRHAYTKEVSCHEKNVSLNESDTLQAKLLRSVRNNSNEIKDSHHIFLPVQVQGQYSLQHCNTNHCLIASRLKQSWCLFLQSFLASLGPEISPVLQSTKGRERNTNVKGEGRWKSW